MVSSWHEQALAQGLEQGQRGLILRQLARRCGPLDAEQRERIGRREAAQIVALGEALLDFAGRADLDSWLAANERRQG